ncbi:MAG TPA: hypothetical protein VER34_11930, partial [Mycobacterium sp.]|nr:hypothetical protein [Mycobacterium sp.]
MGRIRRRSVAGQPYSEAAASLLACQAGEFRSTGRRVARRPSTRELAMELPPDIWKTPIDRSPDPKREPGPINLQR